MNTAESKLSVSSENYYTVTLIQSSVIGLKSSRNSSCSINLMCEWTLKVLSIFPHGVASSKRVLYLFYAWIPLQLVTLHNLFQTKCICYLEMAWNIRIQLMRFSLPRKQLPCTLICKLTCYIYCDLVFCVFK